MDVSNTRMFVIFRSNFYLLSGDRQMKLNLIGKLFFTACAAWLVGKATNTKLRGTKEEVDAIYNAMVSSKRFQEELKKPDASVASVMAKLGLKKASVEEFEKILGIPWPL